MQDYPHTKLPIDDLSARIKVKRGLFSREWIDVKTFEFCHSHCVIKTDEIYEINSPIILSFYFNTAMTDIVLEEYVGKVRKKKKDCSCFHYYIDLKDGKSQENAESAASKIRQIATLIKKKKDLDLKKNVVSQRNQ